MMKEKFLIYKDLMMICPCFKLAENSRFGLQGFVLYGVNSQGKNILFAIALGNLFRIIM